MDKLAYIGVINHDENVEYPLNFSSDGIYEVVCKFNGRCEIKIKSSNYIDAIDINILPVTDLCNKVDTRLGIIDSFIDVNNEEKNTNESDILSFNNHGEYIKAV
ncbi:TPA: hypothetical protein ACGMO0_000706 [Streptococcus agalactiae]